MQIMEWMELRRINYSYVDSAVYLDLISLTKGVVAAENYFNGLPPRAKNKFTYGALMNCYCRDLMADKALALFEKMDELNYLSNLAFNNLMSLYMRLGEPENVPPLIDDLKQRKIPMAAFTYHVWMNSYASLNDIEGVERVYEEMRKEDKDKINWQTYSNLAAIYVKAKHFEKAEEKLKMVEKEVKPQQRDAYHCLLSLYAGTSDLGEVYRVWNSLKSVSPVTNMSYLTMLQTLRRLNDIEGLTKCFKEWESSCTTYDLRLVKSVISAYLSQGMCKEAELVFKNAIKRRQSKGPFYRIREVFILYFLENRKVDLAVCHLEASLSEVKDDGWSPSPEVISAFLKYYEEEKVDGVEKLRNIFKTYNIDDSSLLRTYKNADKPAPGLHQILKEGSEISQGPEDLQAEVHS